MAENGKIRRYVYSQDNFSKLIEFFIDKGRCPRSWKEIMDLGLAKTEVSARALLVIVKDFKIVDEEYNFTQLGKDLRTNSNRAAAFKHIVETYYPDLLEVYHHKPQPFPDKELDDCLIQEGYKSIDPRVRTIRMFKYLLMQSIEAVKEESNDKVAENSLTKITREKSKGVLKSSVISKDFPKEKTNPAEEPIQTQVPSIVPELQTEKPLASTSHTPEVKQNEMINDNVFSIKNSAGKPILVVIPAGSTKADVINVIRLLETTIS